MPTGDPTGCGAPPAAAMMFAEFSHDYPGRPEAVGQARAWAVGCIGGCPDADDVALCLSEATSNAVKFTRSGAGGTFTVRIAAHPGRVRVEVADQGGPATPAPRAAAGTAEGGRGLALIEALATAWGVNGGEAGRSVWMEFTWPDADRARKAPGMPARRPLCEAATAPPLPPPPHGTPATVSAGQEKAA
jgi:anti-sigma regulatory factor (Ser/Thr protein kinase)